VAGTFVLANSTQCGYFGVFDHYTGDLRIIRRVNGVDSDLAVDFPDLGEAVPRRLTLAVRSPGCVELFFPPYGTLVAVDTEPTSVNGVQAGIYYVRSGWAGGEVRPRLSRFVAHDWATLVETPTAGAMEEREYRVTAHEYEDLSVQRQLDGMRASGKLTLEFSLISSARMARITSFVGSRGGAFEPFEVWDPADGRYKLVRLEPEGFRMERAGPLGFNVRLSCRVLEDYRWD